VLERLSGPAGGGDTERICGAGRRNNVGLMVQAILPACPQQELLRSRHVLHQLELDNVGTMGNMGRCRDPE
jgi:hypothetical protein